MEPFAIYGLESQGRALCSHTNEAEITRFFVGTLSPRSPGRIHQLDFEDETNKITKKIYKPNVGEIWQLQCSPASTNLLGICYNEIVSDKSAQMKASLWRLPATSDENQELENVCELSSDAALCNESVRVLDWHPSKHGLLSIVLESSFLVWDVNEGRATLKTTFESQNRLQSGKWNQHLDGNQFALISGSTVSSVDLRTMKEAWNIPKAHNFQVRDIDFNPNKQYYLATCGDDCSARFWDFRNPNSPLKVLEHCHSHWVWRVRYNSFHDQLVLTAGSDSRVILHSLTSISSEPKGHVVFSDSEEEADRQSTPLEEGVLAKYEEHEDAVYVAEWSNYDPWTFASLSYDGRVIINRVPKSHKYKILL